MKNKLFIMYIASILAILIPVPGRFAYGIIFTLSFNILFFSVTAINFLLNKYITVSLKWIIVPVYFVFIITLLKLLLSLWSPILSMQISFIIYIQAFSFYMVNMIKNTEGEMLKEKIKSQIPQCLWYSLTALSFSLIRDVLGYGTITIPSSLGIHPVKLFLVKSTPLTSFFASIPGAAVISALILMILSMVMTKKEAENE